jgi:hypothetical protein
MLILNAIFPIFILLLLGSLLKQIHMTNDLFLKTADKLVYYIFFPIMLFWKIGQAQTGTAVLFTLCLVAILAVVLTYLLSLLVIGLFNISGICQQYLRIDDSGNHAAGPYLYRWIFNLKRIEASTDTGIPGHRSKKRGPAPDGICPACLLSHSRHPV